MPMPRNCQETTAKLPRPKTNLTMDLALGLKECLEDPKPTNPLRVAQYAAGRTLLPFCQRITKPQKSSDTLINCQEPPRIAKNRQELTKTKKPTNADNQTSNHNLQFTNRRPLRQTLANNTGAAVLPPLGAVNKQ